MLMLAIDGISLLRKDMEIKLGESSGSSKAGAGVMETYPYLESLNDAQRQAVTSPPDVPLQILAGPGSGKTRVLTSRVAYLVQHHGIPPHQITAVTFTNKAAQEMRHRLKALLGADKAERLILGTFHATCAKYLRKHAQTIGLSNNFSITDADDTKKTIKGLLKNHSDRIQANGFSLKEAAVQSDISKAKAREESPDAMAIRAASMDGTSGEMLGLIAEVYAEYEAALREANSLDFDDLLVFGLKLFRESPGILASCRHILVDEFQDTNTTQYQLMKCFAKASGCVSVVGDPDQSIYGWRAAEIENLRHMTKDFPGTKAIFLEENYRSTGAILAASHAIVSQDTKRIAKGLRTSHPKSTTVNVRNFANPNIEGDFIAAEIKRMIAYSGGVLDYGDFAVLLRYNALSRAVESSLQKSSIPSRLVGGHKFFERLEVKDILAYLQLADNPDFAPAFIRVVNVPKRAIGDKSIADLLRQAKARKISPMALAEMITDGHPFPELKTALKKNLGSFVGIVRKLRRAAAKGLPVHELIAMILDKTEYEDHLKRTQPDYESRWENVQELISYAVVVKTEQATAFDLPDSDTNTAFQSASTVVQSASEPAKGETKPTLHPIFAKSTSSETHKQRKMKRPSRVSVGQQTSEVIDLVSDDEGSSESPNVKDSGSDEDDESQSLVIDDRTPLRVFLQASMLSTDTEAQDEESSKKKVTISTVHSAKGLEWPVVFIPAVEQGAFPFYRCTEEQEIAEERRLLYVAMTRAQSFLTLSYCQSRMFGADSQDKQLSEFVMLAAKVNPTVFTTALPDIDLNVRQGLTRVLNRAVAPADATDRLIREFHATSLPLSTWDAPTSEGSYQNRFARRESTKAARGAEYWASDVDEYDLSALEHEGAPRAGASCGFKSARSVSNRSENANRPALWTAPRSQLPFDPPRSPAKPIKTSRKYFAEPLPFTLGAHTSATEAKATDLGTFATVNKSHLSMLKNIGLPPPPQETPPAAVSSFQSSSNSTLAAWKNLGQPTPVEDTQTSGSDTALGVGKKRLGMGRPLAPWGTKKTKLG